MDFDEKTAAALVAFARVARESGAVTDSLRDAGWRVLEADQVHALGAQLEAIAGTGELDRPLLEAISLGYLAGSVAHARRVRPLQDVTVFLMDENLVVQAAEGESILRLPWFEKEMFVGRQLPDAVEIPSKIRTLAVDSYREALHGTRTDYAFTSFGHSYSVDAVPIRDDAGRTRFVIAIATPAGRRSLRRMPPLATPTGCTGQRSGPRRTPRHCSAGDVAARRRSPRGGPRRRDRLRTGRVNTLNGWPPRLRRRG